MVAIERVIGDIVEANGVNLGQLPLDEWVSPKVMFYAAVPDERKEVSVVINEGEFRDRDEFASHIGASMETVRGLMSVLFLDQFGEVEPEHIRVLDHIYGCLIQQAARQKDESDDHLLRYGLLTLETNQPVIKRQRLIGMALQQVDYMVNNLRGGIVSEKLQQGYESFELGCRLLIRGPNLHIISPGDNGDEGIHPWHNNDMKFGGLLGWYRAECAIKQIWPDFRLEGLDGKRESCWAILEDILDNTEKAIRMFNRVMYGPTKKALRRFIKEQRGVYTYEICE